LLAIALAAMAVFVALLIRSMPETTPTLFDVIAASDTWSGISTLLVLTIAVFGVWIGVRMLIRLVIEVVGSWLAGWGLKGLGRHHAVQYLIRDLIALHQPRVAKRSAQGDSEVHAAVQD
jgi:hypothetical protein